MKLLYSLLITTLYAMLPSMVYSMDAFIGADQRFSREQYREQQALLRKLYREIYVGQHPGGSYGGIITRPQTIQERRALLAARIMPNACADIIKYVLQCNDLALMQRYIEAIPEPQRSERLSYLLMHSDLPSTIKLFALLLEYINREHLDTVSFSFPANTLLHVIVKSVQHSRQAIALLKLVLQRCPNLHIRDARSRTPLELAIKLVRSAELRIAASYNRLPFYRRFLPFRSQELSRLILLKRSVVMLAEAELAELQRPQLAAREINSVVDIPNGPMDIILDYTDNDVAIPAAAYQVRSVAARSPAQRPRPLPASVPVPVHTAATAAAVSYAEYDHKHSHPVTAAVAGSQTH